MQQNTSSSEPIIPPTILLIAAAVGLTVAAGSAFINQELGFAGFAGLIIALFSMIFWAVMNPQAVRNIFKGRFLQFGGTAGIVTLVLAVALVLIYVLVRQAGLRVDLSQNSNFSLNEQGQQVVTLLGQDPTTPKIKITTFFGAAQARNRDLAAVLLDDIQTQSNGRITYEFVDPDREPLTAERFQAETGQSAVSLLKEDGTPDLENTKLVSSLDQQTLLDALISASAKGDFRAYFLKTDTRISTADSGASGASIFATELTDKYKWKVEEVTPLDVQSGNVDINAPSDGRVLVIPGGLDALPDDQAKVITDYLSAGGSALLFADFNVQGETDLVTSPNLNGYLEENFGFRINNDLVLDQKNALPQDSTTMVVGNFGTTGLTTGYTSEVNGLLMRLAHSITISSALPQGVTVTPIVSSNDGSYIKANLDFTAPTAPNLAPTIDDQKGVFVLGVQAENANTGAKIVVFTTPSLIFNGFFQYETAGGRNFDLARRSLFWAAGYENFAANIASLPSTQSAQELPIIATDEQLGTINFLSVIGVPLGVLFVGIAAWWLRRERVVA